MKTTLELARNLISQVGVLPALAMTPSAIELARRIIAEAEVPKPQWSKCEILEMLVRYGWRDTDVAFLEGDISTLKLALQDVLRDTRRYSRWSLRNKRVGSDGKPPAGSVGMSVEDYDGERRWNHLTFKVIRLAIKHLEAK